MKKILLIGLFFIFGALVGWQLSNAFRYADLTAEGSSYAQIAADLQKSLASKFEKSGFYYDSLSEIQKKNYHIVMAEPQRC
jgi:predicted negative regulator of RcsB-dependent stress response